MPPQSFAGAQVPSSRLRARFHASCDVHAGQLGLPPPPPPCPSSGSASAGCGRSSPTCCPARFEGRFSAKRRQQPSGRGSTEQALSPHPPGPPPWRTQCRRRSPCHRSATTGSAARAVSFTRRSPRRRASEEALGTYLAGDRDLLRGEDDVLLRDVLNVDREEETVLALRPLYRRLGRHRGLARLARRKKRFAQLAPPPERTDRHDRSMLQKFGGAKSVG